MKKQTRQVFGQYETRLGQLNDTDNVASAGGSSRKFRMSPPEAGAGGSIWVPLAMGNVPCTSQAVLTSRAEAIFSATSRRRVALPDS